MDNNIKTACVGRQLTATKEIDGIWVDAQLDKANKYAESIWALVQKSALYASSGSISHLIDKKSTGEITAWPWVELSLTPTPANPLATVSAAEAAKAIKAVGTDVPASIVEAVAQEKAIRIAAKKKAAKADGVTLSDEDVKDRICALLAEWSEAQAGIVDDEATEDDSDDYKYYWYVQRSYSLQSYVVARRSMDYRLYRVDYTVMGTTVSISEPKLVDEITTYVPATKANRTLSAATLDHMNAMSGHAQAGMDAAKAIMGMVDDMRTMAGGMGEGMGLGENDDATKVAAVLNAAMKQKMDTLMHHADGGEKSMKAIKTTGSMLVGGYGIDDPNNLPDATKAQEEDSALDLLLLDAELAMADFTQAIFEADAAIPYALA